MVTNSSNGFFPNFYPNSCPPTDAREENFKVYRLIESNIIREKDFIPKAIRRRLYTQSTCEELALSILGRPEDTHIARKFFSLIGMKKLDKVAVGYITKQSGRIKMDPSTNVGQSHINWWTYMGVHPHTLFNEVLRIGVDI
ncbi:hypothetical protein DP73_09950 [Desulfosporosinus sp. HMP52]|uniref:hypothetical protein n=1 Tax=Desulfosporosinus sp. HMP52 TaxID=1487923 RepID=UPI00051FEAF4|nr:hypothetical protein [Desulfosporosinus sp. HMP52]KGK89371.1 hypothetical protein DP73_09950 [Desulfosporosinus sp. HMP52]